MPSLRSFPPGPWLTFVLLPPLRETCRYGENQRFRCADVKTVIEEVLHDRLDNHEYDPRKASTVGPPILVSKESSPEPRAGRQQRKCDDVPPPSLSLSSPLRAPGVLETLTCPFPTCLPIKILADEQGDLLLRFGEGEGSRLQAIQAHRRGRCRRIREAIPHRPHATSVLHSILPLSSC